MKHDAKREEEEKKGATEKFEKKKEIDFKDKAIKAK